jgi:hypothetical protein
MNQVNPISLRSVDRAPIATYKLAIGVITFAIIRPRYSRDIFSPNGRAPYRL